MLYTPRKLTREEDGFPARLRNIPTPPKTLYIATTVEPQELWTRPCVAIVGSRKISAYGKEVTYQMAHNLARSGVVIVSGLALGTDAVAAQGALDAGGQSVAVLPSSIERIYPASHTGLAQRIYQQGGALISEYPPGSTMAYKGNFIARNRLVAGLADIVLITEAAAGSGTLHTARFALEQGTDVFAVPGNISSATSVGTNELIKSGAGVATSAADILHALGIGVGAQTRALGSTPAEETILQLLVDGVRDGALLHAQSGLDTAVFHQTLTMLEITGKIRAQGNNMWSFT